MVLPLLLSGCVELLVDQSRRASLAMHRYVSPDGLPPPSGTGTLEHPWDLATALAGADNAIQPGDIVWLRGGIYRGKFVASLSGRAGAPIVFRQYGRERVILDDPTVGPDVDDQLLVHGSWLVFWGLELTNSNPDRFDDRPADSAEVGTFRPGNVVNNGDHNRYINLIIHDGGVAFYNYADRSDVSVIGSIIYNNGWQAADRGHGHGIYVRSNVGPVVIRDNVVFNQFGGGIHAYTDPGADGLRGITIEGNVVFGNGSIAQQSSPNILLGGASGARAERDTIRANLTYVGPGAAVGADDEIPNISIGFGSVRQLDVQVADNYSAGGNPVLDVREWSRATVAGNVTQGPARLVRLSTPIDAGYAWRANTHYSDPAKAAWALGDSALTFAGWKSRTGLGATDVASADLPRAARVFVRPNRYESGRAFIAIYNWPAAAVVSVDLRNVLSPGDRYVIRSVQDLFGAAVTAGVYNGTTVRIPLRPVTAQEPVGGGQRSTVITGPAFEVFLVTKS